MQRRIDAAVTHLAETGEGDVRKLTGQEDTWRLRVGDYRVIFTYDTRTSMLVLRAMNRRDAYRR